MTHDPDTNILIRTFPEERIDYEYYVQRQIEPLIRTIAQVFPLDVDGALWGQMDLFAGTD